MAGRNNESCKIQCSTKSSWNWSSCFRSYLICFQEMPEIHEEHTKRRADDPMAGIWADHGPTLDDRGPNWQVLLWKICHSCEHHTWVSCSVAAVQQLQQMLAQFGSDHACGICHKIHSLDACLSDTIGGWRGRKYARGACWDEARNCSLSRQAAEDGRQPPKPPPPCNLYVAPRIPE